MTKPAGRVFGDCLVFEFEYIFFKTTSNVGNLTRRFVDHLRRPTNRMSSSLFLHRITFSAAVHTKQQMMATRGVLLALPAAGVLVLAAASDAGGDNQRSPLYAWGEEHEGRHLQLLSTCRVDEALDFVSTVSATTKTST